MTSVPARSGNRISAGFPGWAGCALAAALVLPVPIMAQTADGGQASGSGDAVSTPVDPAADLTAKRDSTRSEMEELAKSIGISRERTEELAAEIAEIEKNTESLRSNIVESAAKRKDLETQILAGEKKLEDLRLKEAAVRRSLLSRRDVLASVLAALQRMGRNPPPALLVTPDDALASVRSAILLGAVVPGIRKETEALTADLRALSGIQKNITAERATLTTTMTSSVEEEKRLQLLIAEKEKLREQSAQELAAERNKAAELAGQATSLAGLIGSLETEIASVRKAAENARILEEERARLTDEQREAARELARQAVPDKNRIAPAYEFSELRERLALPVAGTVLRHFGEEDGTNHPLQGMVVETSAGALVTAPADGWIVFSGKFRSYGEMVILNPGNGYHIVIAGMERASVQQGQFVVAGEPLAVMGEKRVASATALALETNRPTLYIEFRKDGKSIDSRPWWASTELGKARNDT